MQGQCALDNCHFQQKTTDALSAFEQQMTTLVTKEQFGKEKAEVVLGLEEFTNKNVKQLSDKQDQSTQHLQKQLDELRKQTHGFIRQQEDYNAKLLDQVQHFLPQKDITIRIAEAIQRSENQTKSFAAKAENLADQRFENIEENQKDFTKKATQRMNDLELVIKRNEKQIH
jgi:hypothetical protein